MLVFQGMDNDEADIRAVKLKALQTFYKETDATALDMLAANALSKANAKRGTNLVINSHGNQDTFADLAPQAFYDKLVTKGFENGAFQALYLVACDLAKQNTSNTIVANFAREFNTILAQHNVAIKLYAPRGVVTYDLTSRIEKGETIYSVTRIYVHSADDNKDYPLDQGMLMVMF